MGLGTYLVLVCKLCRLLKCVTRIRYDRRV